MIILLLHRLQQQLISIQIQNQHHLHRLGIHVQFGVDQVIHPICDIAMHPIHDCVRSQLV